MEPVLELSSSELLKVTGVYNYANAGHCGASLCENCEFEGEVSWWMMCLIHDIVVMRCCVTPCVHEIYASSFRQKIVETMGAVPA